MNNQVVIIGAGGVGREIASVLRNNNDINFDLKGFIDDGMPVGSLVNKVPVLGGIDWLLENNYKELGIIIAIGNPGIKRKILNILKNIDVFYPTIVHPNASIHDVDNVKIGRGCYIADGCIFTTNIIIEDFCFINTSCTLQHDTFIGENSILMPGVRITGGAKIGSETYISPNCVIATACIIEKNSTIKTSII